MAVDVRGLQDELEERIEAFEDAQRAQSPADLAEFLPALDHPLYLEVLQELIRIDLEYGWSRGEPTGLDAYRQRFPRLNGASDALREIAFEEYRLRLLAGQRPDAEEYRRIYGLDAAARLGALALPGANRSGSSVPPQQGDQNGVSASRWFRLDRLNPEALFASLLPAPGDSAQIDWFRELHQSAPEATIQLAELAAALPEVGSDFLGFRLIRELGRGAFGRVYLARQGGLANRFVALKVSTDLFNESQTLAQLQHTNIVPLFSLHRAGSLQAVCMPFLGETTLADLCKDRKNANLPPTSGRFFDRALRRPPNAPSSGPLAHRSYTAAVLWIGARLAEGLAHAHEHGILHRDLKPANVLLSFDGQPVLLDFNLASDTKLRSTAAGALIGGTLPYMAPEQLRAFTDGRLALTNPVTESADVYSLGLVLLELLTGRLPGELPRGTTEEIVARLLEQRSQPLPRLPGMSPAAGAILRRCLECDASKRYPSAQALAEDIDRHLADLPLRHTREPSLVERGRKWVRRHPRLATALLALLFLGALAMSVAPLLNRLQHHEESLAAQQALIEFDQEKRAADFRLNARDSDRRGLSEGLRLGRQALERYQVLENENWVDSPLVRALSFADSNRLREEVADLLQAMARATWLAGDLPAALALNRRAEACCPGEVGPRALWQQRADFLERLGEKEPAAAARRTADSITTLTSRDQFLLALALVDQGRSSQANDLIHKAIRQLEQTLATDRRDFRAWYLKGNCHDLLLQGAESRTCYTVCVALSPACYEAFFNRAMANVRDRRWREACVDLDQAIELRPDDPNAYFHRALAAKELGNYAASERDLSNALERGMPKTRLLFLRADVRGKIGDHKGAAEDRRAALARDSDDEHGWLERGNARLANKNVEGALADYAKALEINPRYMPAWQNKAHILAALGKTEAALQAMERGVALHPEFVPGRLGRGVLLARLGKREAALRDAAVALERDAGPRTFYMVANIYALSSRQTPDDVRLALQYLRLALSGGFGLDVIDRDSDMDSLRGSAGFDRIVRAARELRAR